MEKHDWEINKQKTRLKINEQCMGNKKLKHRIGMRVLRNVVMKREYIIK